MTYKPRPVDILFTQAAKNKKEGKCANVAGTCPSPDKILCSTDFVNELSYNEWKISGMCQECQDEFFK